MRILHLDENHPVLADELEHCGHENIFDFETATEGFSDSFLASVQALVIRSRFKLDKAFLSRLPDLRCIGRVGAGLENIDLDYCRSREIKCFNAPEGNRTAVGEHALGMLLSLYNKLNAADQEVRSGKWNREKNRGLEVTGKTVGLIGYGNMGKSFSRLLSGFDCEVIFYDIKDDVEDAFAKAVTLSYLQEHADVISLHTPETEKTVGMIDAAFIADCVKTFTLLNTARGSAVVTEDLVDGLKTGKIRAAGLDVLEYEKSSFENLFAENRLPDAFRQLTQFDNVLLTPHVAGWTVESKIKLAETIANKMCDFLE